MRTIRFVPLLVSFLAGFLVLFVSHSARAQLDDLEPTARTDFTAGRYQEALDLYAKLYMRTSHPTYMRNIGRCYQGLGKPDEAIKAFHQYLSLAPNLEPKQRADIDGFIREMEELKRRRAAAPAVAEPAAPPAPTPLPRAPERAAESARDSGAVEASLTSGAAPEAGSAPVYKRWWFWTAIAAVAVGSIATVVVLSAGSSGSSAPGATTTFGTRKAMFQ